MKNLFDLYVVVSTQNKSLGLEYDVKVVFSSRSTFIFLVSAEGKHYERASSVMFNLFSFGWAWPIEIRVRRIVFLRVDLKYLRFRFCT